MVPKNMTTEKPHMQGECLKLKALAQSKLLDFKELRQSLIHKTFVVELS
jgi:hypothetical protein